MQEHAQVRQDSRVSQDARVRQDARAQPDPGRPPAPSRPGSSKTPRPRPAHLRNDLGARASTIGRGLRHQLGRLLRSKVGKVVILGIALSPALVAHAASTKPSAALVSAPLPSGTGVDVSYPQCAKPMPEGAIFAVVGLNDGRPDTTNPCLIGPGSAPSGELAWAFHLAGSSATNPVALYVNTDDPGPTHDGKPVPTWPTDGSSPFGPCLAAPTVVGGRRVVLGYNSLACAWRYGNDAARSDVAEARQALARLGHPSAFGSLRWWLDVETDNTWQHGPPGEALNAQVLEGFVAGLRASGAKDVGVYSTAPQWQRITGLSGSLGPLPADLAALPVWLPGAGSRTGAALDCSVLSFTGGPVLMTQWTTDQVDHDLRCAPLRGAAPLGP